MISICREKIEKYEICVIQCALVLVVGVPEQSGSWTGEQRYDVSHQKKIMIRSLSLWIVGYYTTFVLRSDFIPNALPSLSLLLSARWRTRRWFFSLKVIKRRLFA